MEIKDASLDEIKQELRRREEAVKEAAEKAKKEAEMKVDRDNELSRRFEHTRKFIAIVLHLMESEFTGPNDANLIADAHAAFLKYLNTSYIPDRLPGYVAVECVQSRKLVDNAGVVLEDDTNSAGIVVIAKALYEAKKAKILDGREKKSLVSKDQLNDLKKKALPANKIKKHVKK